MAEEALQVEMEELEAQLDDLRQMVMTEVKQTGRHTKNKPMEPTTGTSKPRLEEVITTAQDKPRKGQNGRADRSRSTSAGRNKRNDEALKAAEEAAAEGGEGEKGEDIL